MATPSKQLDETTPLPQRYAANGSEGDSEPEVDIGARLRSIRGRLGLSQRELAKRAGVTNGTISLIELNRVSPTVASLRKVLRGFPMSIADFFSGDALEQPRLFYRAPELTRIRVGKQLVLRQVGPSGSNGKLQVLHEHYAPGGDTGDDLLVHEGEEAGVIVRGAVEVTVGEHVEVLGPGDAYSFDSRIPHRFRNVGEEPAELVSACTPPTF